MLESARAAAVYPYTLAADLKEFDMRVDQLRRYAVEAIRDRSANGDEAAVKRGRWAFLCLCEQGINAAERVGNPAYAALMQRQREEFDRDLSAGQAPPPPMETETESDPQQPAKSELVDFRAWRDRARAQRDLAVQQPGSSGSDAAIDAIPLHELYIGCFLEYAAGGTSFFEAMDALWSGKTIKITISKGRIDEIERVLVDRMREVMFSRGIKTMPRELSLWPAMLYLAPQDDQAQDALAQALRGWPDHGDTPLAECLFQGRRYVALLYAALNTHPDHAGGDPPEIIQRWQELGATEAESARLVDWYCTTNPMQVLRIERDLKIKLRKQGWHV
jgi:hypothetical protein